jgi:hypothetical protein
MKLVTVATKSGGYFPSLQDSCKRFNAQLDVLGFNAKWTGFMFKFILMEQYLSNLADTEIVCFIDGYDVIMLRNLTDLENTYKLFLSIIDPTNIGKIVVGCDKAAHCIRHEIDEINFTKCKNKRVNSGTYIGYVKNIKLMLNSISNNLDSNNDQDEMIKFCILNPNLLYIDCDCIFFCTMLNPFKNYLTKSMRIFNNELYYNGIKPFFAHGNGFTNMNDLITQLGYQIYYDPTLNIRTQNYISSANHIILPIFLVLILLFINSLK